ncbi:MAG: membrane protein [Hyphococcus sp.]|nr:MAG: membrane protein [Marinicaulis sp.]
MSDILITRQLRAALFSALLGASSVGVVAAHAQDTSVFEDDPAAKGETPAAIKGYEIAARSDRTDHGFSDSKVDATMVLRNAAGQTSERSLSFSTLEKENESEGDKSLVIFNSPRDVEGTALLSHAKILVPDDQWLFLPALKRVKRIASANKSGPFVGSEFAFEDFTLTELNKFTYAYSREEEVDGAMMDVVERFPRYEKSGYSKQVSWIDQEIYQAHKVEFYDRRGDLLKTLTLSDYREYDGVWRAHKFSMVNHKTNKETDLVYGEYEFKTGLDSGDFVKGVLQRIR